MPDKPSYAAIVASPPDDSHLPQPQQDNAGPSEAPPPYDAHQSKKPQPQVVQPQGQNQQQLSNAAHPEQGPVAQGEWVQPPEHVVRSRALRRFWTALFWAWLIWTVVGLIVGGGVSDVENNRHWHKHQKWDKTPGSYQYELQGDVPAGAVGFEAIPHF